MKKLFLTVSSLFLMICLSAFLCLSVSASTVYEQENNNDYSSAQRLYLGDSVIGIRSNADDDDYYKVIAPADGKIDLQFLHEYKDNGYGWTVKIYKYNGEEYDELSSTEIRLNHNEKITLPYIGAVKDTTYYIKVTSPYLRSESATIEDYTLVTKFAESKYYEKEVNDSYKKATPVSLNASYNGILGTENDQDYYKIVAPANGKIDIKFCHTYEDNNLGWSITFFRYSDGQYNELGSSEIHHRDNEKVVFPFIGAVKGGIYYIKVASPYFRSETATNRNYTFKITFTKSDYYEKEVNNSYVQATPVVLNNAYSGNLNRDSDSDYYRIKPVANGKISIKFKHKYKDSDISWNVKTFCYYDGGYTELSNSDVHINSRETIDFSIPSARRGRVYYVVVSKGYWNAATGENYTLDINFDVPNVSGVSAKASTSSISLSWKNVSGVSGYEVQIKNGKTYKTVATTSKTKVTVKKLKAGTKYTFRTRTYMVVSGKKYYSAWRYVYSATTPTAPSLKVSAGTKSATLKAGKQAATGFVIYRADSKNGTFKKIATVKGSSLSFKNKGLTSKKTYYYKVRAYVSAGGTNYYGAYSSVKSVKVK